MYIFTQEIDDSIKRIHSYEGLTIIQRNAKKVQQSSGKFTLKLLYYSIYINISCN